MVEVVAYRPKWARGVTTHAEAAATCGDHRYDVISLFR